jgi:Flp pilus assembly protein TadD
VLRGERTWIDATAALGAHYESQGRFADALHVSLTLASEQPYQSEPYALAATLLGRMNRPEDALRMYEAADGMEASVAARRGIGRTLLRLGRSAEAIEPLRRALILEPADATTRYDLAAALAMSGQTEEARTTAAGLLRDNPGHAGAARLLERLQAGE